MMFRHNIHVATQRCRTAAVVTGSLFLAAACAAPTSAPAPSSSVPRSLPVLQPAAFTTPVEAHCAWVAAPSTSDHAVPGEVDGTAGHWELKVCGAPAGDTSGMGGPVDWRFVPDP